MCISCGERVGETSETKLALLEMHSGTPTVAFSVTSFIFYD